VSSPPACTAWKTIRGIHRQPAAVTLVLDFPFLIIFLANDVYYNVTLTCIALAIMGVIRS